MRKRAPSRERAPSRRVGAPPPPVASSRGARRFAPFFSTPAAAQFSTSTGPRNRTCVAGVADHTLRATSRRLDNTPQTCHPWTSHRSAFGVAFASAAAALTSRQQRGDTTSCRCYLHSIGSSECFSSSLDATTSTTPPNGEQQHGRRTSQGPRGRLTLPRTLDAAGPPAASSLGVAGVRKAHPARARPPEDPDGGHQHHHQHRADDAGVSPLLLLLAFLELTR